MKFKGIFTLLLISTLFLSGCEKDDANSQKTDEAQVSKQNDTIDDTPEDSGNLGEGTPEGESMETEIVNMGEGAPDSAPIDIQESEAYEVGEVIKIASDEKELYELTIDEIVYTDKRDEYTEDPGNVLLVTYTYKNLSEDALLIDDMRFQMMKTDETTVFDSYYLSDVQVPEPADKDGSCTAQVAYASAEKVDSVVLAYQDTVHTEISPVKIKVSNLQ